MSKRHKTNVEIATWKSWSSRHPRNMTFQPQARPRRRRRGGGGEEGGGGDDDRAKNVLENNNRSTQITVIDLPSPDTRGKIDRQPNHTLNLPGAMGRGAAWAYVMIPDLLQWISIIALIFGGCCSNVSSVAASRTGFKMLKKNS